MTDPKVFPAPVLYADAEDIQDHLDGKISSNEMVRRAVDHMNQVVFRDSIAARGTLPTYEGTEVLTANASGSLTPSVQDFIDAAATLRRHAMPWHVGTVVAPLLRRLAPQPRRPLCSYGAAILAARSLLA